jgi:DNA-binding FrmR family transcriptional regulator
MEQELAEPKKRKKIRPPEEKKDLLKRLRMAEGQIRGIQNMVENDAYCPEILVQVSAVTSALNSFNRELLTSHIKSCVADDIRTGHDEAVDELTKMLKKLMK